MALKKRTRNPELTEDTLNSLRKTAAMAKVSVFNKGDVIFQKGEERDFAYIIESGEVHIKNGEVQKDDFICSLGPGEIFGEMALMDSGRRSATAIAAEDTTAFVIPKHVIQKRLDALDPLISLLINLLVERYRSTRLHVPADIREGVEENLVRNMEDYVYKSQEKSSFIDAQRQRTMAIEELKSEQELRHALEEKQFIPYLQPIVELPSGKIKGFEALIRWNHPERGIVTPIEFIPVAERTNVIQLLDAMMLEQACLNIPALLEAAGPGHEDLFISVNISGINFETLDMVEVIGNILKSTKADPKHIKLEVTESALIGDPDHAEDVLNGIRGLDLEIALDDFGTGYSSLNYLHKFSINTLKIDRTFVSELEKDTKSLDIVRAIVNLAKVFNLKVVAEGIEREKEVIALSGLGCEMGQGYLFGKPIDLEATKELLRSRAE